MNTIPRSWPAFFAALAAAALLTCASSARADDEDQEPSAEKPVTVVVQQAEAEQGPDGTQIQMTVDLEEIKPGKYWIGVVCTPLDNELVKTQLSLESGLVVTEVVPDSPAHKSGLQPQDILIKVGEKPLDNLRVLVTSTEEAQTNPLTLTIVRKGQQEEVQVTPAERPAKFSVTHVFRDSEAADEWKMLQDSLREFGAVPKSDKDQPGQQDPIRMMYVMPGIVLPEQAGDFPKDLEVTITKKGDDAAKITVKRGDDQWDVDGKSLDKLPEDIRPHIQRMLGASMNFSVGGGTVKWSGTFPKPLALPHMLKKSLRMVPDEASKLLEITPELRLELREKIKGQLQDVDKKLEQVQTDMPAEALEKIQQELKSLREQLEQLRAERAKKTEEPPQEEDDQ